MAGEAKSSLDEEQSPRDKVLSFLEGSSEDSPVPTLEIAKHVNGVGASKKTINPLLYKMEKDGVIKKKCEEDGSKPSWYLCD